MSDGEESEDGGWDALEDKKGKKDKKSTKAAAPAAAVKEKKEKKEKKGKKKDEVAALPPVEEKKKKKAEEPKAKKDKKKEEEEEEKSNEEEIISLDVDYPDSGPAEGYDSADDSAEEEIDDQTATLLQGFESSDEEMEDGDGAQKEVSEADKSKFADAKIPGGKKMQKKMAALQANEKVSFRTLFIFTSPQDNACYISWLDMMLLSGIQQDIP